VFSGLGLRTAAFYFKLIQQGVSISHPSLRPFFPPIHSSYGLEIVRKLFDPQSSKSRQCYLFLRLMPLFPRFYLISLFIRTVKQVAHVEPLGHHYSYAIRGRGFLRLRAKWNVDYIAMAKHTSAQICSHFWNRSFSSSSVDSPLHLWICISLASIQGRMCANSILFYGHRCARPTKERREVVRAPTACFLGDRPLYTIAPDPQFVVTFSQCRIKYV
jgi:hypothetical protein